VLFIFQLIKTAATTMLMICMQDAYIMENFVKLIPGYTKNLLFPILWDEYHLALAIPTRVV
jgi:hypothetical protein